MRKATYAYSQRSGGSSYIERGKGAFNNRKSLGSHGSAASKLAPATKDSVCQRCEKAGHYTADCTNKPVYKARPTRTQQLLNPKKQQKLLPASESFSAPSKEGVAAKILEENADKRDKAKRARSTSESSSESDSDSESESDSSSEADSRDVKSPPRSRRRVEDD